MPIYEYQCQACGHLLDALQKIEDAPLKKCPDCGKPKLKRLLSAPMFLLKGSGWYETDFKSDKERRKNLADRPEPEKKEAETQASAAVDAKSADKAEDKKAAKADAAPAGAAKAAKPSRSAGARASRKTRAKPKARRR